MVGADLFVVYAIDDGGIGLLAGRGHQNAFRTTGKMRRRCVAVLKRPEHSSTTSMPCSPCGMAAGSRSCVMAMRPVPTSIQPSPNVMPPFARPCTGRIRKDARMPLPVRVCDQDLDVIPAGLDKGAEYHAADPAKPLMASLVVT